MEGASGNVSPLKLTTSKITENVSHARNRVKESVNLNAIKSPLPVGRILPAKQNVSDSVSRVSNEMSLASDVSLSCNESKANIDSVKLKSRFDTERERFLQKRKKEEQRIEKVSTWLKHQLSSIPKDSDKKSLIKDMDDTGTQNVKDKDTAIQTKADWKSSSESLKGRELEKLNDKYHKSYSQDGIYQNVSVNESENKNLEPIMQTKSINEDRRTDSWCAPKSSKATKKENTYTSNMKADAGCKGHSVGDTLKEEKSVECVIQNAIKDSDMKASCEIEAVIRKTKSIGSKLNSVVSMSKQNRQFEEKGENISNKTIPKDTNAHTARQSPNCIDKISEVNAFKSRNRGLETERNEDGLIQEEEVDKNRKYLSKDLTIQLLFQGKADQYITTEDRIHKDARTRNDNCEEKAKLNDHEKSTKVLQNKNTASGRNTNYITHSHNTNDDRPMKSEGRPDTAGRKDQKSLSNEHRPFYVKRCWNSCIDVRMHNENNKMLKDENYLAASKLKHDVIFKKKSCTDTKMKQNTPEDVIHMKYTRSDVRASSGREVTETKPKHVKKDLNSLSCVPRQSKKTEGKAIESKVYLNTALKNADMCATDCSSALNEGNLEVNSSIPSRRLETERKKNIHTEKKHVNKIGKDITIHTNNNISSTKQDKRMDCLTQGMEDRNEDANIERDTDAIAHKEYTYYSCEDVRDMKSRAVADKNRSYMHTITDTTNSKQDRKYVSCNDLQMSSSEDKKLYFEKQTNSHKDTKKDSCSLQKDVKINNDDDSARISQFKINESCKVDKTVSENGKVKAQAVKEKAKQTIVYVYLSECVSANDDVVGYIYHRMGSNENIPFEIKEVSNDRRNFKRDAKVKLTISFPSANAASKAVSLLHKSNRGTANRVLCLYTYNDEREHDKEVEKERKQKAEFDKSALQMVETAKQALDKHERKVRTAAHDLEETEKNLHVRRGVSLEVFSILSQEKQAREDKLDELKSQMKEFKRYLTCLKDNLNVLKPSDKDSLIELRKSLGIECHKLEAALPMYARREDILKTVKSSNVSVILGETGSGKSTQLVQYLFQAGFAEKGIIACTQPRKIAAANLAKRVSSELASKVGQVVGYHVGMRRDTTKDTKIIFMTDHVLLNECLKDETLSLFSCIIIDEAHERSIYTDLLLGMIKKCLLKRPDLQIIITSATINPGIFVSYFGGSERCPVLQVSGRTFPVDVLWDDDMYGDPFPEDYERKAINKAIEVHTSVPVNTGDILVFVTSPMEAERCCSKFSSKISERSYQCRQLHGKLKQEDQQLVFEPSPMGVRKIVFATNSAETSITIPGVKYVIDTGLVKEMRFDPKKKMNCLSVVPVSQSSADQRKGRAGRTAPGVCYRIYSQNDFEQMETAGKPEILRVNLGQALLKLLQLKVDPLSFDFVESPNKDTMTGVMDTLRQLGAVEGNNLTDLGKWIANLPLEPRLGVLVKKGLELGMPIESLVVATCSSAGGVFFRAGSLEEKKKADLKKVRFCHSGGDLLTVLNVYREWNAVNENAKGKWCITNCINGKTMKAIRESVKEILDILKKDMKIDVKYELCPEEKSDVEIQKLVMECMMSNICFFLGHERAGYITTDLLQHVQIHPSSSLVCMGQQPKWIVYDQILKTSDDYVTNISPIADEDLERCISQGHISLDREYLESRVVSLVCKVPVGKYVFWKFVGPLHRGRRELEELIRSVCDDTLVVIEADKQKGEVVLYAATQYEAIADMMLKQVLTDIPELLKHEAREISLGNDKSGVRAVIGHGGCVVDILMPHEYRSMNIKQKPFSSIELTEEGLKIMFSSYGSIDQIWQAKGNKQAVFWGKVTFLHEKDATAAAEEINSDEYELIEVVPITYASLSNRSSEFTMRLSWCRRLGKGIAYVYLEYPEDEVPLLTRSPFTIGENLVDIQHAKRESNLMIRGLSAYVSEDEIKQALSEILEITIPPNSSRFKVIIPREQASQSARQTEQAYRQLEAVFSSVPLKGNYRMNIKEVQEQTARFTAFICFTDPDDCETVMEECADGLLCINNAPVDASMNLKTSVVVQKSVFEVVKRDVDQYTQKVRRKGTSTTIKRREIKSGNIVIDINSTSPRKLAKTTKSIHDIVDGESLECETIPNLHLLFTKSSRQVVADIQKSTNTFIFLDQRTFKVTVYGSIVSRQTTVQELKLYLNSRVHAQELEVVLKGQGNPPGVMKELIVQYGTGLQGFKEAADLAKVLLNYKLHKISMQGTEEAIAKGCELIQSAKEKLSLNEKVEENDISDCPICICPVELSQIYRLEYCGHAYCKDCLRDQILNALNDKKFPIECAVEGCGKDLMIRDINIQIKQGAFTSNRLVAAAVDCLVAKNSTSYHYCLTPNCEMVYKISSNGELFACPLCFCRICTACHIQYHDGVSCAMYRSASRHDDSVKEWLREKPDKRKTCPNPKCGIGIEKISGCNHVTCTACRVHICWICLKFFSESGQCYGHMETSHGSFV